MRKTTTIRRAVVLLASLAVLTGTAAAPSLARTTAAAAQLSNAFLWQPDDGNLFSYALHAHAHNDLITISAAGFQNWNDLYNCENLNLLGTVRYTCESELVGTPTPECETWDPNTNLEWLEGCSAGDTEQLWYYEGDPNHGNYKINVAASASAGWFEFATTTGAAYNNYQPEFCEGCDVMMWGPGPSGKWSQWYYGGVA